RVANSAVLTACLASLADALTGLENSPAPPLLTALLAAVTWSAGRAAGRPFVSRLGLGTLLALVVILSVAAAVARGRWGLAGGGRLRPVRPRRPGRPPRAPAPAASRPA